VTDKLTEVLKRNGLALFFLLILLDVFSQNPPGYQWVKTIDASASQVYDAEKIVRHGNYLYTIGTLGGTLDFDFGPGVYEVAGSSSKTCYLLKTDLDGNFVWVKTFENDWESKEGDIAISESGDIAITGIYRNTMDVDPGPNEVLIQSTYPASSNYFLTVLDSDGNYKFHYNLFGQARRNVKVTFDEQGALYFTAYFNGTVDFNPGIGVEEYTSWNSDMCLVKFNNLGHYQWSKVIASKHFCMPYSFTTTPTGNLLIYGEFRDSTDFDPGPGEYFMINDAPSNAYDFFLLELSAQDGQFIQAHQFGADRIIRAGQAIYDANGNLLLTGRFEGEMDIDLGTGQNLISSGPGFQPGTYLTVGFLWKLNSAFETVWFNDLDKLSGTYIHQIVPKPNGNILLGGNFTNTIDWDPGPQQDYITATAWTDAYIQEYMPYGDVIWGKRISGNWDEAVESLCLGPSNELYALGINKGNVAFDSSYTFTEKGIFLAKLDAFVGLEELDASKTIVYPNPTDGDLNIKFPEPIKGVSICDQIGKIYKIEVINNYKLDLSTLPKGIYFITIEGENISTTKKVIRY